MAGFAAFSSALGSMLSGQAQGNQQTDLYKQELELRKQQLGLEGQKSQMELSDLQRQAAEEQRFEKSRQDFMKDLDENPALAGLRPMKNLLAGMGQQGTSAVVDNYFRNVSTQVNRRGGAEALRRYAQSDPANADAWNAAATMVENGQPEGLIKQVLLSRGIGLDAATQAFRHAEAFNQQLEAKVKLEYLKVLKNVMPGATPPPPPSPIPPPAAPSLPVGALPGAAPEPIP